MGAPGAEPPAKPTRATHPTTMSQNPFRSFAEPYPLTANHREVWPVYAHVLIAED
jgi:hypothetical protein